MGKKYDELRAEIAEAIGAVLVDDIQGVGAARELKQLNDNQVDIILQLRADAGAAAKLVSDLSQKLKAVNDEAKKWADTVLERNKEVAELKEAIKARSRVIFDLGRRLEVLDPSFSLNGANAFEAKEAL